MHDYFRSLIDPKVYTKAKALGLCEEWFSSELERLFIRCLDKFHSLTDISDVGNAFEWISVVLIPNDELRAKFSVFVSEILAVSPHPNPSVVTDVLRTKYLSRLLTVDLQTVVNKISNGDYSGAVSELQRITADASSMISDRREADIRDVWVHTEARKVVSGIFVGYPTIDRATSGLRPGELFVVLSGPSEGKTTCMINLAYNIFRFGKNVLFFSIEMPLLNMIKRLQSHITKIPNTKLKVNELSTTEQELLNSAINTLANTPNYFKIIDAPGATIPFIESVIRDQPVLPDVVVVDYLGIIQHNFNTKSNWEALNAITILLRSLGRKYNIPIITAAQVNREGVKTKREFYEKSDIALNFALTFHADIILSLRLADPEMLTVSPICLLNAKFLKDRDGELPAFTFKTDFSTYTMEELVSMPINTPQTGIAP